MRLLFTNGYHAQPIEVVSSRLVEEAAALRTSAALLAEPERRRANHFTSVRARRRFILARAGLRRLLGERLGVQPQAVELVYGPHGKPALAPSFAATDLHFNVAHSEDVVVYGFTLGCEIGVDVEAVRAVPDCDTIATRFFSRRETKAYGAMEPCDRPLGFFNCWTRKEAFVKALGDGLYFPLHRFDVSLAPGEPAKILRVGKTPGDRCGWHLESFCPAPGFVAAVVSGSNQR